MEVDPPTQPTPKPDLEALLRRSIKHTKLLFQDQDTPISYTPTQR
jgi:hypothetical protein